MAGALRFEDLHVGDRWESPRRTVTESDIVNFACLTGDFDPLHVDHEFARQSPFRKPIAHGLLGLSWVAGLASNYPRVETAAFVCIKSWEFLKPIFIGDTLQVVNEVIDLRPNGRRRGYVVWKRTLVNQSGAIVQLGTFETLVTSNQATSTPPPPAVVEERPSPTPPPAMSPPPALSLAAAEPAPPNPTAPKPPSPPSPAPQASLAKASAPKASAPKASVTKASAPKASAAKLRTAKATTSRPTSTKPAASKKPRRSTRRPKEAGE